MNNAYAMWWHSLWILATGRPINEQILWRESVRIGDIPNWAGC